MSQASSSRAREDDSLLFTLNELRQFEVDRVREEQERARAAAEAKRLALEVAEGQARAAAEARAAELEAAARQAREESERRERDEQLRLEEAERKARVEAHMRLEQQRISLELEAMRLHPRRSAKGAWLAAIVLTAAVGGLGLFAMQQMTSEKDLVAENARLGKELAALDAKLQANLAEQQKLTRDLAAAQTPDEKQVIQEKLQLSQEDQAAVQAKLENLEARGDAVKARARKQRTRSDAKPVANDEAAGPGCADPDDPLCGAGI